MGPHFHGQLFKYRGSLPRHLDESLSNQRPLPHGPRVAAVLEGTRGRRRSRGPREAPLDLREPARGAPEVHYDYAGHGGSSGPGRGSRGPLRAGGPQMSAGETELRRGIAVLDQYRANIETLAQQQEIIRVSLEEHLRARETLVRYQEAGKAAEILVPIGANSFLAAQSREVDKAFVSIGSDLLVYDDSAKQLERLDARIKSITEAANAIGQRLGQLQRRAGAQGEGVPDPYDRVPGRSAAGGRGQMFKALPGPAARGEEKS